MHLTELHLFWHIEVSRRSQHHKEGVAVALDFRPLVTEQRIFDREWMQAELISDRLQFERIRSVHADPAEAAVIPERFEGLLEVDGCG